MTTSDDKTVLTLDDEDIVTRRQAIGLAALVLGVGTVVSGRALASDDENEGDSESSGDSEGDHSSDTDSTSDSSEEEESESDGDGA